MTCRDTLNMSFMSIGTTAFTIIMLLVRTFHKDYSHFSSGLVHS